ncbi:MAG TPA: hypothetical protein VEI06_13550 [Gemmatimonadaceae bacterium]|nr:hypothetical protein [Gemmatimonadaceae bacterium]
MSSRSGARNPLKPPGAVRDIARRLEDAGFETWCVGGAVRDALLGLPHLDWDLATAATPAQVQALFRRTIPVGLAFGTVGVLDPSGTMHEVTTFRRDVRTDGRHAEVQFGASLDEDLARRDFTINAIALSPATGRIHDPFDGQGDLTRRVVRAVGAPDGRMREDRLRALRALRFAARFGFTIEADTWRAIVASAPHLTRLSMERVQQEIQKTMEQVPRPSTAFRLWQESGALKTLIPSLAPLSEITFGSLDVLPRPARGRPQRLINRLTALFAELDAREVARALRSLRFSNSDIRWMSEVVERWRALETPIGQALRRAEPPPDAMLRRWVASMGRTRIGAVLRLGAARYAAMRSLPPAALAALGVSAPPSERAVAALYRRAWRAAFRDPVDVGDLAVDGDDLITAGVPAGPKVGRTLHLLLDQVIEDPSRNTVDWLLAYVRSQGRQPDPPERGGA